MASPAQFPKQLGPYEIVAPLGAGGMGEVYRARDTRLGREVALKLLRSEIANDPALKARFEREAKTVASLNHPNIVALFEVGNFDGVEYTASELVDGESLRALLNRDGALPVRRALDLATQMADGMAAAHAAGVVHRDLKPENMMLTRDGRVKILDFGLARIAVAPGSVSGGGSSAETIVAPAQTVVHAAPAEYKTSLGMVMGTAAYMSPEQARGREADYRADQFSFGLVLYEMLAGRQAFVRGSAVETMSAIIREEPEPLDAKVPAPLRWIVDRCLEKDPVQRFDSTKDLYQQLRTLRDHFSEAFSSQNSAALPAVSGQVAAVSAVGRGSRWPLWIAAVVVAAAAGVFAGYFYKPAGADLSKYKFTPIAPEIISDARLAHALWSPDGKSIAYVSDSGADKLLQLQAVGSPVPQTLARERSVPLWLVGWSADRGHILYMTGVSSSGYHSALNGDAQLKSVATVGGQPQTIMTLGGIRTYTSALSPDGKALVVAQRLADGQPVKLMISDPVGSPFKPYPAGPFETAFVIFYMNASFSPDGKNILFIRSNENMEHHAWLLPYPAGSGQPREVLPELKDATTAAMGAWMPDSRHVVLTYAADLSNEMQLRMGRIGSDSSAALTAGVATREWPAVSPDGKRILYTQENLDLDVVAVSLTDGSMKSLVATSRMEDNPQWSANSPQMVYVTDRTGEDEVWVHTADGEEHPIITPTNLTAGAALLVNPMLSPDGKRVIFAFRPPHGKEQLWESAVAGGAAVKLLDTDADGIGGDWSPDGSEFVFVGDDRGAPSLSVVSTAGNAHPRTLLANFAHSFNMLPSWSPTGEWIAYRDESNWRLISPDGKNKKDLGNFGDMYLPNLVFSRDGKTLYGVAVKTDDSVTLLQVDVATGQRKDIKQLDASLAPKARWNPAVRFTLTPDGKSLTYAVGRRQNSLWMLEGFPQP